VRSTPINHQPKVAILLATNNPNSFIYEQIESIRNQQGVQTVIYWGDYNSSASIKNQVRSALNKLDFHEIQISSAGVAHNFFELLKHSNEDFVAFSDQDDVWLPGKLISHVNLISTSSNIPVLVHSNSMILEDGKLKEKNLQCGTHTPLSLFFKNCCQGCTITINSSARSVILNSLLPDILWHDWWMALVLSVKGKILFNNEIDTLYRLHASNTIGLPNFRDKIFRFAKRPAGLKSYQIEGILNTFPDDLHFD
jgi:rhamnosyltransferase